ncbi:MAG: MerR family transcriptional regulator, heat shock protein HspR [Solirubrobacteraceae bacterium]|jgi:MerR family transcriptional regulator/heat shock protein HspR|nr:MerR family transcriptional regulator, heat shock protein HspR [Solirubrobacteraceae bacterium]
MTRRTTRIEVSGGRATRVEVSADRGVFMISVAAELAEMHPQTLRMYESRGLIEPKRSPKGTRLYSHADVERLRRIQQMTAELGLNLAGVERVLELELELEVARARLENLERQALVAQAAMEEELDRLRRSVVRYDLVPYAGAESTALVRRADARSPFKPPVRRPPAV